MKIADNYDEQYCLHCRINEVLEKYAADHEGEKGSLIIARILHSTARVVCDMIEAAERDEDKAAVVQIFMSAMAKESGGDLTIVDTDDEDDDDDQDAEKAHAIQ